MKVLAFLSAIWIFTSAITPCCDSEGVEENNAPATSETALQQDDTHQEPEPADDCSVLCSCSCCHSLVVVTEAQSLYFAHGNGLQPNSLLPFLTPYMPASEFWQPPQQA